MAHVRIDMFARHSAHAAGLRGMLLILACALVGVWAGCTTPGGGDEADVAQTDDGELVAGSVEVTERVSRAVAPGQRVLVLNGFGGDIQLRGTSDSTAQLQFIKRGRGTGNEEAREALQTVAIRETGTDETYTYAIEAGAEERAAVNVRGTVPTNTHLRISVGSGTIDLQGITGPIEIDHQNGDIAVTGAGADVDITSRNSDIRASMRQVPSDANILLRTANGDVTLGIPDGAALQVQGNTSAGDIITRDLSFSSRTFEPGTAGARFTGQLGQGNATAELRTEHGDIRFVAAEAMPDGAEPADDSAMPADTSAPDTSNPDTMGTEPATDDTTEATSPADMQQTPPGTVPRTDTSGTTPTMQADSVQSM